MTVARSFARASIELVKDMGFDPQDLAAAQEAFLFGQAGLSLVGMERETDPLYPETYRLAIEGDGLPEGGWIKPTYTRNSETGEVRLVSW